MTLEQFLDRHNACTQGRKRAAVFTSLQDAWQKCSHEDLFWVATRPRVLTEQELRRFSVFCARSVQHLMRDHRSIAAVEVAERHADGLATDDELRAAYDAASAAAYAATKVAAKVAAKAAAAACAAYASADAAAYAAAYAAANAAAYAATKVAAKAASAAAYSAARERQAAWLRQTTKPNFS